LKESKKSLAAKTFWKPRCGEEGRKREKRNEVASNYGRKEGGAKKRKSDGGGNTRRKMGKRKGRRGTSQRGARPGKYPSGEGQHVSGG